MPKWLTDSAVIVGFMMLLGTVMKLWGDLRVARGKEKGDDRTADNVALTTVSGALKTSLEQNFAGNESYVKLLDRMHEYAAEVAGLRSDMAAMRVEMNAMQRTLEDQKQQLHDCEEVKRQNVRLQRENQDLRDMYNAVMALVDTVENGKEAVEGAVGAAAKILKRITTRNRDQDGRDNYPGLVD